MSIQPRPPVVTIMGHVDHGKTSLLDYIRKAKVAAGEAGGITQHIGAYQAQHNGKCITFIDTPGHAAFSKMRSRGAAVTDIVILVVAADDGVKPQTIESIQHIKQAVVPVIVAINKSDLPAASPEMVKAQLTEHGIEVTGYGGSVDVVEVSAKTGKGVDELLDTILLTAELNELSSDSEAAPSAIVIESVKDSKSGSLATILVKAGTFRDRDMVYTPTTSGKIKRMVTAAGEVLKSAGPSTPVEVLGFESVPMVGELVTTVPSQDIQPDALPTSRAMSIEDILRQNDPRVLIILKSDTVGTLQAIEQQLTAQEVQIISSGVGDITETEIELADTTGAQVIGFHVKASKSIQKLAGELGVRLKTFKIIYELLDNVQKQVLKMIEPTIDEEVIGVAQIAQIFEMKGEKIAGCTISTGQIKRTDLIHIKRADQVIGDPKIKSIHHGKEVVESRKAGEECGIVFTRYTNFQVGDTVVAYVKKDE